MEVLKVRYPYELGENSMPRPGLKDIYRVHVGLYGMAHNSFR